MISPLLTDLYQITMAYGYWKLQIHEREAVFHQLFRRNPFKGNYALACGLASAVEFLQDWHFAEDDLTYLAGLTSPGGELLFEPAFLDYLGQLRFTCDVDAIPEGTVVFPHEPLIRVKGPLLQGQLVESTLLNIINFQTLVATKATRVCRAAGGDPVLEFGMRRAQGPDGALSASRAAYIGGCTATSNVLAGKRYGIPVQGTHAHSWVTAFPDEMSAFLSYAKVMPHNCVLLVDTYDTLQGVKNAIEVGKQLRAQGAPLRGIRLDSGDMATLSQQARALLDAAGLNDTKIIASNSLDEYAIHTLKQQGASISVWGVGTHLTTAYDQPALDGVYKLSAIRDDRGEWEYKIKLSEQVVKVSNPGIYQVRRYYQQNQLVMDVMYDEEMGMPASLECVAFDEQSTHRVLGDVDRSIDLLVPVFRKGKKVYPEESIHVVRQRGLVNVSAFYDAFDVRDYPVTLEKNLFNLKQQLIQDVSEQHDNRK